MYHNNGDDFNPQYGVEYYCLNAGIYTNRKIVFEKHNDPDRIAFRIDGYYRACNKNASWGEWCLIPLNSEVDIKELL